MFADEISGNASKKRQEQARARRRQLKKEKEQKSNTSTIKNKQQQQHVLPLSTTTEETTKKKKPSIVEAALEKRQLRQMQQKELVCITKIQSIIRMYLSNLHFIQQQNNVVQKRLNDLKTLFQLLQQKEYAPPPATVSLLTHQVLFLLSKQQQNNNNSSSRMMTSDGRRMLWYLLKYALLPGIISKEVHLDPLLPWFDSSSGKITFQKLVYFTLQSLSLPTPHTNDDNEYVQTVETFLRVLLGIKNSDNNDNDVIARPSIVQISRMYLLSPPSSNQTRNDLYLPNWIRSLLVIDQILLDQAVDQSVSTFFKKKIPLSHQQRNQMLIQIMLDIIVESPHLQVMFVTQILSIPFLTYQLPTTKPIPLLQLLTPLRPTLLLLINNKNDTSGWNDILPPMSMKCPPSMALLANIITIEMQHSLVKKTSRDTAAVLNYFHVLTSLLNEVPVGVFSNRHSAVEWIDNKTPIVLSPIIKGQCQSLWTDYNYVRNLFISSFSYQKILESKNDKDRKEEEELNKTKSVSVTSLAAREATADRSKRIWQQSKWAKALTKRVSSLFSSTDTKLSSSGLMNTTSLSHKLATGTNTTNDPTIRAAMLEKKKSPSKTTSHDSSSVVWTVEYFGAICQTYATILSRCSGADITNLKMNNTTTTNPAIMQLLNVLCFSTKIIEVSWALVQSDPKIISDLYTVLDTSKRSAPIRSLSIQPFQSTKNKESENYVGTIVLYMFVSCLTHTMIITDDIEIYEMEKPLPLHQLRRCILLLKRLLYRACCLDQQNNDWSSNHFGLSLISASAKAMKDLFDRSSRRPLCVPKLWLVDDLLEKEIKQCQTHDEYVSLLMNTQVLKVCPFLVSFKRRLKLFERIVTTSRVSIQGSNETHNLRPGIVVHITRDRVLEDGLLYLNKLGRNLRQRIVVQYLNQAGTKEVGVDVGGLFKEFWSDLSNMAFDPNYALFRITEGQNNCLYPNPSSKAAHGSDSKILFEFLGRILGKALYEGITIQPQFAHFFLSFLRGDYNFLHMLPDLSTMDPTLYNNLMFLKTYEGDAGDLCLTFTIANDDFGTNKEVELIKNGAEIDVTNTNKQRYIGLVAKHHVCDRVREQAEAFTKGLWDVIDKSWLRIFNEPELQVLISGSTDGKLDINDMKSNTRYVGGYTMFDINVRRFWKVIATFDSAQQGLLLRFITSCERAPPLGFACMNPPFTIQRVPISRDADKLPSASTCFNTLKLPTYSSEKVLKDRLLYSIKAGAGFELT